jgi:VCBS repeat-containing protein
MRRRISLAMALGSFLTYGLPPVGAQTRELLSSMPGFWTGPGRIEFDAAQSEALRCKAYYTTKEQIDHLTMAIHCASVSYKIELRAQLTAQGNKLSGSWEERSFNASGTVTGQIDDKTVSLVVNGGGFSATMLMVHDGAQQTVSITTQGIGFKKVDVCLNREPQGKPDAQRR